ncbi:ribosome hibernation-promoting factor, HPF/YfiA family [Truepera radiovictrix]|uniref:Ribosome hibernation promoting factor n=1 Tax=Truepera radiovictrix (strain DSM 17093 / CIP 108686 / LMG 22925 / RQ-24) TaxID=649638 RepID=D7CWU3_TRURR|nr:ribosome-associated translation inhibitor RaiA [Truepera radiovictrix]ADI13184.1 ribosomal subunit interface protein [Truepera radiovictrix DSM 17093]WMT58247.1 ribosome-associated translation inhibitor RaiA [Truepera radiovictrix]
MDIYQMIGRNIEVTDAMRAYAEEKLEKLERFSDHIVDAKVVMSYATDGNPAMPAKVEVQLNVPNGIVRAEESGPDTYAATDLVVEKLERQLRRFKERRLAKRNQEPPPSDLDVAPMEGAGVAADESQEREPAIVRVKRHVMRPMSPEDAALQMEALGHAFFVFHNMETDTISVLYRRHDGDYGLIEPANN